MHNPDVQKGTKTGQQMPASQAPLIVWGLQEPLEDKIGPNGERVAGMTPPMPEWAPGRIQAQLKTHIQSSACGAGGHTSTIKHFREKTWL